MTAAETLSSSVNVVSRADVAVHWLVQHTAPVRAKPDGRPHLEGAHYKIPEKLLTSYVSLLHPTRHAYTSTHLPIPPLFGLAA